jgi:hypothetical protein
LQIAFHSRLFQSDGGIRTPHTVNIPREEKHGDQANTTDRGGENDKSPVVFNRRGR